MSEAVFYGTGRRKRSIARVYMVPGKGEITVNGQSFRDYLCRDTLAKIVMQPLVAVEDEKAYNIDINVNGGGLTGQAGAIILGISKALISHDESLKKNLKKDKLTTRDSRVVERKKYGHRKARRSFQFSKR